MCHKDKPVFTQDFAIRSNWAKIYHRMLSAEFGASGLSSITWSKVENFITPLVFTGVGLGRQSNIEVRIDLLPSLAPLSKDTDNEEQ